MKPRHSTRIQAAMGFLAVIALISLAGAKRLAQEALEDFRLSEKAKYKKTLKSTKPGQPILVKNHKKAKKDYYYLVPFADDSTRLLVMADGYYCNYLGSAIFDRPKGYLEISQAMAKGQAHRHLKQIKTVCPDKVRQPWLVRKPSIQSSDPLSSIWKTEADSRTRYVNQKG